jgi:DNA-3-methyladenine glycosylase
MGHRICRTPLTAGVDRLPALLAEPVEQAAPGLLGCLLTAGGVTVRLTEVEAYAGTGEDPASHAHRGRTPRNLVMFGPPGFAYVYFTYGMHWCLNVVAGAPGQASAVLLRAGAVVNGIEAARARRPSARLDRDLARGPARLTQALGIDAAANGTFLLDGSGPITLCPPESPVDTALIRSGPRVGVAGGHDTPWRFWLDGEPTVSAYRRQTPRRTVL